jgi:hypothetical protein
MAASVVAADTTSSGSVATEQGETKTGIAVDLEAVKDSELPKQVELTEAVKVRLLNERGSGGVVGLPAGARVEVTGRDGHMLKIVFAQSAGQVDIAKTTALQDIANIRAANKAAEEKRAALATPTPTESLKESIKPATRKSATKAESEPEEEIPVSEYGRLLVAHPWLRSFWSGKPREDVPGDIPMYIFKFKEDGTWTRESLTQLRNGVPAMENGDWKLKGDQLRWTWQGRRFDPSTDLITIKFLSRHRLSFGGSLWTAEIEQND